MSRARIGSIIDVSDDEYDPSPPMPRSGNKRVMGTTTETPNKFQRGGSMSYNSHLAQQKCFELPEVRDIIHRNYISLPGQVDPKAIEELIRLSMQHWA